MRNQAWSVLPALLALAALLPQPRAAISAETELRLLLPAVAADSLAPHLRALEGQRDRPALAAEASMLLGQLRYARGEYRQATDAFARAAARLEPARKPEARYWSGIAWLALGDLTQARAALEEVIETDNSRRPDATLALALAWQMAHKPERAFELLDGLLEGNSGEVGPAALESYAALAEGLGRGEGARLAQERLLQRYPRSMEAAAARLAQTRSSGEAGRGALAVVIGSFIDVARARSLAGDARRTGFPDATVVTRGQGLAAVHNVRLGTYPSWSEARKAGEQAARALGVSYEVVRNP